MMTIIPLLMGLSMVVVSGRIFDFRRFCHITHDNPMTATCNASNPIVPKDLVLKNDYYFSLLGLNLINFENIILDSNVNVRIIKIKNSKNVSLYISNLHLNKIHIESVDHLTMLYQVSGNSKKRHFDEMVLQKVKILHVINEGKGNYSMAINKVEISNIEDFEIKSNFLHIVADKLNITDANIRFDSQSSLFLEASTSIFITKSVVSKRDANYLSIKTIRGYITSSSLYLKDGVFSLESENMVFSNNSFYGFENESLLINGKVKFVRNDIFTHNIVHLLDLKSKRLVFTENNFDCTICGSKEKLVARNLTDLGDTNYCYADCKLSLNKYKEMLSNDCVCNNGELTVSLPVLCAPCSSKKEIILVEYYYLLGLLLLVLLFVLITVISCCVCYKNRSLPQQYDPNYYSKILIYRRPENDDDEDNGGYETLEGLSHRSIYNSFYEIPIGLPS